MEEVIITCPYCWQSITLYLDIDIGDDKITVVEDCRVCCRPIEISYSSDHGQIKSYNYQPIDGNN